jgi:NTP pyrophosphatase (non-canonical NTP hydrolase)
MTLSDYQAKAKKTALYPDVGNNLIYPTLGLAGEAGEVANNVKKIMRDSEGKLDEVRREKLVSELGDVLWYVSQIASELNIELEEVARRNVEKLYSRLERGVISGDGDNR